MSKSRILEPKSYVKWAWNLVQSVSLWFVQMRGQQKELRRRGGNDRLFKWGVKDTTNVSEVGHCLILTARLRETQAKEVMLGKKTSFKSSVPKSHKKKKRWIGYIGWHGKVGGGATKTTFFLSSSFFSLWFQWHQTPISNSGSSYIFMCVDLI